MLSYLKDGNSVPASSDMPDGDQAASSTEDYLTVSGQSQKVRRSTMILVVLFAIGALGIWLMVKKTTPATVNAEPSQNQVQLETALAQLDSMQAEMDSKMNSIAGRFYQFNNVDQVGVEELKKNPFIRKEMDCTSSSSGAGTQQQAQIRQEAQVIGMGMELWSITETPKGMCCMIDDKVLYEGDAYRNMTVKSIMKKSVTLEYKGIDVELKID
jgi:preprotein translocase subunit SecG